MPAPAPLAREVADRDSPGFAPPRVGTRTASDRDPLPFEGRPSGAWERRVVGGRGRRPAADGPAYDAPSPRQGRAPVSGQDP